MNDTSANSDTSEFPLHCSSPLKSAPIKKLDNKLRSVCLNIQSIKSKGEALWNLLDSSNPDILFGCETWLNPNITDNEILPENTGYNIFRIMSIMCRFFRKGAILFIVEGRDKN